MKKFSILILALWANLLSAGALQEIEKVGRSLLPGKPSEQKKIFTTDVESKQEALEIFQQEKNKLERESKDFLAVLSADLEETRNQIVLTQELLRKDSENELLKRKLALLNELYHLLKEIQQLWEQQISSLNQLIKQITDYLNDPEFLSYRKQIIGAKEKNPTFDDLQEIYQLILELDKRVDNLTEQEKNAATELENRKRSAEATIETFDKKKKEQEAAIKQSAQGLLTEARADELWELQEKIFNQKKKVDDLKLKEISHKIEIIKLKLFITKSQRNVLRDLFKELKSSVQVSEADVAFVKDEFEKKKQKAYAEKRLLDFEIERTDNEFKTHKQELEMLSKRYNIQLDSDLDKWDKEPKQTVNSFVGICEVGAQNTEVLFLARKKDFVKSQKDLVDEKIRHEETLIKIKETFHKIRYAKFTSQELNQELKNYDMIKAGIRANLSFFNERRSTAMDLLETQKKAAENIEAFRTELFASKDTLFKDNPKEYNHCLMLLNAAREKIKAQISDLISNIIGAYTDIINLLNTTNKQIDFIVSELNSVTIWYRPQYAVSWEGLTSLIPDVQQYFADLGSYASHLGISTIAARAKTMTRYPMQALFSIFQLLLLIVLFLLIRFLLPRVLNHLQVALQAHPLFKAPLLFFIALVRFIFMHFRGIALWSIIGLSFKLHILTDPYLHSIFYLVTIPYFLYLASDLLNYFIEFNRNHQFLFISKEFEFRFIVICSGLLYSTIILFFFRKAFMLGNYSRSELPVILVAINFIILQIALISLITKELVLSLIPRKGIGDWLYLKIDRYYYAILMSFIAIIILTNPYVGFGRLVLYVINKIILSILLFIFLIWLYRLSKRFCSYLFFIPEEDEGAYDRFANAKKWYGFSIIVLFILFVFFGSLLLAKIWGWPEQLAAISHPYDIIDALQRPFTHVDQRPISIWVFLRLVAFILGGIALSYSFNYFVIGKIFDILLIDPGVQNTVTSITNYLFFALAVIIGFNVVGLTSLLYWLLALVVGIGWVIKDPVSDFVSYFIILVQRPVKVGDLVRMNGDEEGPGVVRSITPRSVVLRRRNSTTIIIPNSSVINRSITNWNYARDFIAFDDIMITISYKSDPLATKAILLSILGESSFVLKNPKPIVRLENFSENGYVFLVRGYLSSNYTLDQWDIASDIRLAIVKKLKEAGIEIAVPVRVIKQDKPA